MSNSLHEELLLEPKTSTGLKIIAAIAAVGVAVLLLGGYFYLRQRHAEQSAVSGPTAPEPRQPPKAMILVDEATLGVGKTTLAGTVKNTSTETLSGLQVELELKSRKGAGAEKRLVRVEPADLQPEQEGRYSIELSVKDYASARLVGLRSGNDLASVPFTSGQGQKRQPERLESKTITVDKRPPEKRDEFLNSPDNPARVP